MKSKRKRISAKFEIDVRKPVLTVRMGKPQGRWQRKITHVQALLRTGAPHLFAALQVTAGVWPWGNCMGCLGGALCFGGKKIWEEKKRHTTFLESWGVLWELSSCSKKWKQRSRHHTGPFSPCPQPPTQLEVASRGFVQVSLTSLVPEEPCQGVKGSRPCWQTPFFPAHKAHPRQRPSHCSTCTAQPSCSFPALLPAVIPQPHQNFHSSFH